MSETDINQNQKYQDAYGGDRSDDDSGPGDNKKQTAEEKIKDEINGFDEMIKFMDFSFERAFQ